MDKNDTKARAMTGLCQIFTGFTVKQKAFLIESYVSNGSGVNEACMYCVKRLNIHLRFLMTFKGLLTTIQDILPGWVFSRNMSTFLSQAVMLFNVF